MSELSIWQDETETVIAHSAEDADAVVNELCGGDHSHREETGGEPAADRWTKLDGTKTMTMFTDKYGEQGFRTDDSKESGMPHLDQASTTSRTQTRDEWCAELGRCHLGSTEF